MEWNLHFLGTGAAHASALGSSAGVLERDGQPLLLIDCGADTLQRYVDAYGALPPALFITHTHMDHVAGLENLFAQLWFPSPRPAPMRLITHAALVPLLQGRVADYPGVAAEGGVNFWDAFQLLPCSRGFWLDDLWFEVFPSRHHRPNTSFGLALPGSMVWTGDTRPIPEMLDVHAHRGERVAHDCGLQGNPSHTGIDDLERDYPAVLRQRLIAYHYGSEADGEALESRGLRVARPGQRINLPPPLPVAADAG